MGVMGRMGLMRKLLKQLDLVPQSWSTSLKRGVNENPFC